MAFFTLPFLRAIAPCFLLFSTSSALILLLSSASFSPLSQVIFNLLPALIATQMERATIAKPFSILNIFMTPWISLMLASSKLFSCPPNTGERTTVAYTIPSSCTSIENWAFPFNLGWVSFLFIFLPIMENCLGFFSDTLLGIGTWLAFSVNEP